jgi:hypothetical protein
MNNTYELDIFFKIYQNSENVFFTKEENNKTYVYGDDSVGKDFNYKLEDILNMKSYSFTKRKEIILEKKLCDYTKEYYFEFNIAKPEERKKIINIYEVKIKYNSIYKTFLEKKRYGYSFSYFKNGNDISIYKIDKEDNYYKVIFLDEEGELRLSVKEEDIKTKQYLRFLLMNEFGIGFIETDNPFELNYEYVDSLMTSTKKKEYLKYKIEESLKDKINDLDIFNKDRVFDFLELLNIKKLNKIYIKNLTILPPCGSEYSPMESSAVFLTEKVISDRIMKDTYVLRLNR